MPSINSAQYAQRIIQTESHESPSFLRKVHRLDPPSYPPPGSCVAKNSQGPASVETVQGGVPPRLDVRKYSFSQRTINVWNNLSTDCVQASSVNMFKNKIDKYLVKAGYT